MKGRVMGYGARGMEKPTDDRRRETGSTRYTRKTSEQQAVSSLSKETKETR